MVEYTLPIKDDPGGDAAHTLALIIDELTHGGHLPTHPANQEVPCTTPLAPRPLVVPAVLHFPNAPTLRQDIVLPAGDTPEGYVDSEAGVRKLRADLVAQVVPWVALCAKARLQVVGCAVARQVLAAAAPKGGAVRAVAALLRKGRERHAAKWKQVALALDQLVVGQASRAVLIGISVQAGLIKHTGGVAIAQSVPPPTGHTHPIIVIGVLAIGIRIDTHPIHQPQLIEARSAQTVIGIGRRTIQVHPRTHSVEVELIEESAL